MRIIEQIGAYAGLAAIPGLAILSALYFSQARDVRRLREWAGRAPERAAEQAEGGRVATQQAQQAPAAAVQETPAAATPGAAVAPAAAAAKPAAVKPAAVKAAAAAAKAKTPAEQVAAAKHAAAQRVAASTGGAAAATASAGTATADATGGEAAGATAAGAGNSGTGTTGTASRPVAAAGGTGIRRPGSPRVPSAQTSILKPASAASAEPEPWYRRLAGRLPAARYVALIVAGVLIVGGGAAFGIAQLTKEDSASPAADKTAAGTKRQGKKRSAVSPSDVTVTVLNGTGVTGLARETADKLESQGFQIGNKLTASPTGQAESVVQFLKPEYTAEAKLVAAKLGIGQIEPADNNTTRQAGPAHVVVILGADKAPPPGQ